MLVSREKKAEFFVYLLSQRSNCCKFRRCIRGHIPMHTIFYRLSIFHSCPVCITYRTPDKDRKIEQLFFFSFMSHNPETSMSSVVNVFVHAISKYSKKLLTQKVGYLGFLGLIRMLQPPFNST